MKRNDFINIFLSIFIFLFIIRVNIISDVRNSILLDILTYNERLANIDDITLDEFNRYKIDTDILILYVPAILQVWKWTEESMINNSPKSKMDYHMLQLYKFMLKKKSEWILEIIKNRLTLNNKFVIFVLNIFGKNCINLKILYIYIKMENKKNYEKRKYIT